MDCFSPEVAVYLYKFIKQPCLKYYCRLCVYTLSCFLDTVDKLQTQICETGGPSLAAFLDPLPIFET